MACINAIILTTRDVSKKSGAIQIGFLTDSSDLSRRAGVSKDNTHAIPRGSRLDAGEEVRRSCSLLETWAKSYKFTFIKSMGDNS